MSLMLNKIVISYFVLYIPILYKHLDNFREKNKSIYICMWECILKPVLRESQ